MSVAIDAIGAEQAGIGVTSLNYTGLTIGASLSNGALVVPIYDNKNTTTNIVKWGSAALTLINAINFGVSPPCMVQLWQLLNPQSGNQTLSITWDGTIKSIKVAAMSFKGVNQAGGVISFPNSNTNTAAGSSAISLNIASAATDAVIAVMGNVRTGAPILTAVNQTQLFVDNTAGPGAAACGGAGSNYAVPGSGVVSMTGTLSNATDTWGIVATDIAAATGSFSKGTQGVIVQ